MSTQIQIVSSGGVPSGFKYNIQVYYGLSPAPSPPPGVAYALYFDDGEGGYTYGGWNISYIDANGNDIGSLIFANVNLQPFSIFTTLGTYCLVQVQGSTVISNFGYQFSSSAFIGVSPETLNLTKGYFNFGTSQSVPTYNGYAMVGNLLGATFAAGSTSYIGIGANTANATESLRAVALVTSQGFVSDFFVTTNSLMTGTMVITIMKNGLAVTGGSYTIPNGSAALKYPLGIQTTAPNGTTISLRIVQSTSLSAGINQFGWTAK